MIEDPPSPSQLPPPPSNPVMVAPIAAIIFMLDILTELKVSGGVLSFESLERRLQKSGETSLGKSHPYSVELIQKMLDEVRTRDV